MIRLQRDQGHWVNVTLSGKAGKLLLGSGGNRFRGLALASSVVIDLQEVASMPNGVGVALYQDEQLLHQYLASSAPYVLPTGPAKEGRPIDRGKLSVDGSMPFVALLLDLALPWFGRKGLASLFQNAKPSGSPSTSRAA